MSAAQVKGWCPGAYRPMMSGDGLIVRIRPMAARLSRAQVLGLCDLAQRHGNGILDLTNRANLQMRGVSAEAHETVLAGLNALGLLDTDPALESRRNVLVSPFWEAGDLTHRLHTALISAVPSLPDLPGKFGFAIDTGPARLLQDDPADIRLERSADDCLLLRADGTEKGRPVSEDEAIAALIGMARWAAARITPDRRRMARLGPVPGDWQQIGPADTARPPDPGPTSSGAILGAPFGQIDAAALGQAMTHATALRTTPWRLFLLEGGAIPETTDFITEPGDPLLTTDACPGAPFCTSATVETRDLARRLAPLTGGDLHVSGCAKGCARRAPASVTLIGASGRYDLVRNGTVWDEPAKRDLVPDDVIESI